jgi:tetratricopeptide (TPR) repeat protein
MSDQEAFEYRYWAFISYSSRDKKWARWLHRAIETYGIPAQFVSHPTPAGQPAPKRFQPLFRDRDELAAASALGPQIEESLRSSRYLIVICSPHAAQSQWVNKEVATFQQLERHERILALIVDGEPNAGDGRECFPEALRSLEPLAADARPESDGKANAKLKLLAGMLGVSFDALRQRENHRRIRRLQLVAAVALALMTAFAALAWYANRQRVKAIAARGQAESVLEFLVFNIRDDLKNAGRLDIAEKIRRRVDEYYIRLGTEASQPLTLHNQAAALMNEGLLSMEKGDLEGSAVSFRQGLKIAEKLAEDHPENAQWQWDVSAALENLGTTDMQQGLLEGASDNYQRCLGIRERLVKKDPANAEWQHSLSSVHGCIGNLQLARGDTEGALQSFKVSEDIMQTLCAGNPANGKWLRDYNVAVLTFCSALMAGKDLVNAHQCYQQSLKMTMKLAGDDLSNADRQHDLTVVLSKLGDTELALGDLLGANLSYLQALKLNEILVAQDPNNSGWQYDLSTNWGRMGDVLLARGDWDKAVESFRQSLELTQRLAASDRSNVNWQHSLYVCYLRMAQADERTGAGDGREWYRMAYEKLDGMKQRGFLSAADRRELEDLRQKAGR